MAEQTLFALTVESSLVPARIRINDRVAIATTLESRDYASAVNHLVVPGANLLRVTVGERADGSPTSAPAAFAPPAKFAMTLRVGVRGVVPGPDGMLAQWTLREPLVVPEGSTGAHVSTQPFQADAPWECAWRLATPSTDDLGPRQLLSKFVEALRARDLKTLTLLNMQVYRDRASAMQLPLASVVQSASELLGALSDSKLWLVSADLEKLTLAREGGGRVVRVLSFSGEAPILVQTDSRVVPFELTCAFIDREWTLVL